MNLTEQIQTVGDALAEWAQASGGSYKLASDEVHALDLLRTKPAGFLVAVLFDSEDPRGDYGGETGKVDRGFRVILSRGRGFKLDSGESLTSGPAGGEPMLLLAEQAREVVRNLRFASPDPEDAIPGYRGTGQFRVDGFVLDAFEIRFSIPGNIPHQR
jgi:hypothetical protein